MKLNHPHYPQWFGESERNATSAVFASGNTGGAVLPWVVGTLSTHTGSLRLADSGNSEMVGLKILAIH